MDCFSAPLGPNITIIRHRLDYDRNRDVHAGRLMDWMSRTDVELAYSPLHLNADYLQLTMRDAIKMDGRF